jgi:hypothetical protein
MPTRKANFGGGESLGACCAEFHRANDTRKTENMVWFKV